MIFHLDGSDDQMIVALDKATGKVAWKTRRSGAMNENPQLRKSYATPLILELPGRTELLSPAADWLYSYDPATGEEIWKLNYEGHLGFSNVAAPRGRRRDDHPTDLFHAFQVARHPLRRHSQTGDCLGGDPFHAESAFTASDWK